jgi:hypothetical protein
MRSMNVLIPFGIEKIRLSSKKNRSVSLSYKKGDGRGVVNTEASLLPTTYKIL